MPSVSVDALSGPAHFLVDARRWRADGKWRGEFRRCVRSQAACARRPTNSEALTAETNACKNQTISKRPARRYCAASVIWGPAAHSTQPHSLRDCQAFRVADDEDLRCRRCHGPFSLPLGHCWQSQLFESSGCIAELDRLDRWSDRGLTAVLIGGASPCAARHHRTFGARRATGDRRARLARGNRHGATGPGAPRTI